MLRVLRNTSSTLFETFYADEVATLADGAVTVSVTRQVDGTVVNTGSATIDGDSYRWAFPAQDNLDSLVVAWTGTFSGISQTIYDHIEVVGNRIFSIEDARALDDAFADPADYPSDLLDLRRTEVEAEFERITGTSFIPRFKRVADSNPDWADEVIKITLQGGADLYNWSPYNAFNFDRYGPDPVRDVYTEYEYGLIEVPPEVHREALKYVRILLLQPKSAIPDRASSYVATDGGLYTLATPGRAGYETGIPSVDAVLKRYTQAQAMVF